MWAAAGVLHLGKMGTTEKLDSFAPIPCPEDK